MDVNELAAAVEEVSQTYAQRYGIERDANWFVLKLLEEAGELVQSYLMLSGQARTKGRSPEEIRADFGAELADVFCHTLLLARFYGIDLEREVREKWLTKIP